MPSLQPPQVQSPHSYLFVSPEDKGIITVVLTVLFTLLRPRDSYLILSLTISSLVTPSMLTTKPSFKLLTLSMVFSPFYMSLNSTLLLSNSSPKSTIPVILVAPFFLFTTPLLNLSPCLLIPISKLLSNTYFLTSCSPTISLPSFPPLQYLAWSHWFCLLTCKILHTYIPIQT